MLIVEQNTNYLENKTHQHSRDVNIFEIRDKQKPSTYSFLYKQKQKNKHQTQSYRGKNSRENKNKQKIRNEYILKQKSQLASKSKLVFLTGKKRYF